MSRINLNNVCILQKLKHIFEKNKNLFQLKNIFTFLVVLVILVLTIGINITEHTCSACGTEEKSVTFITKSVNCNTCEIEMDKSMESSCCDIKIQHEHNSSNSHKCCDFKNVYLKIINLFSPSNNYEVVDVQIFDINIHFKNIISNLFYSGFNRIIFKCIKIPDSIPILSKVCQLIL